MARVRSEEQTTRPLPLPDKAFLYSIRCHVFCVCSHSVLSAININQNYSITLGLFPFQLLHYTVFGIRAWFSKCVVLGILWEFDTFNDIGFIPNLRRSNVIHRSFRADTPEMLAQKCSWMRRGWLVKSAFWFLSIDDSVIGSIEQPTVRYTTSVNSHSFLIRSAHSLFTFIAPPPVSYRSIAFLTRITKQNSTKFVHLLFEGFSIALKWKSINRLWESKWAKEIVNGFGTEKWHIVRKKSKKI